MSPFNFVSRRDFLKWSTFTAAGLFLAETSFSQNQKAASKADSAKIWSRKIPKSGVMLPVIGLGTWITFNVGADQKARDARTEVMKEFFRLGGNIIDSSPMYGSSEAVIGYGLSKIGSQEKLFSATKVWTSSAKEGPEQIKQSQKLWGVQKFDLFQVHNLVSWQDHLKTLFTMKEKGELKHVGVTTSHGRRHDELEKIMKTQPVDFIQVTYNLEDRQVEEKILPLAQEKGIAVIANRPFQGGDLLKTLQSKNKQLPPWAKDIGVTNWPEYLLKFVVSHPSLTCAIPATSKVEHLRENMAAGVGPQPDAATRMRMITYFTSL